MCKVKAAKRKIAKEWTNAHEARDNSLASFLRCEKEKKKI